MKTLKGMPQTAWVTWVFLAGKIRRLKLWYTAKGGGKWEMRKRNKIAKHLVK